MGNPQLKMPRVFPGAPNFNRTNLGSARCCDRDDSLNVIDVAPPRSLIATINTPFSSAISGFWSLNSQTPAVAFRKREARFLPAAMPSISKSAGDGKSGQVEPGAVVVHSYQGFAITAVLRPGAGR